MLLKSIYTRINIFTCTGFLFPPLKPRTTGNSLHNIYCGDSGIMYGWNIVEVNDHQITMGGTEF